MKIKKIQLLIVQLLIAIVFLVPISSCDKDDDNTEKQEDYTGISGEWEFTLSPNQVYMDTAIVHGMTGSDFETHSAVCDEIYLYEDENHDIYGVIPPHYKITGKRDNDIVLLTLYAHPQGYVDVSIDISDMVEYGNMQLKLNSFGFLEGDGDYVENPDKPWSAVNTYFVEGRKINDITNSGSYKNDPTEESEVVVNCINSIFYQWFCSRYVSMESYSLIFNGIGFYCLGNEGPGDNSYMYTMTDYVADQFGNCTTIQCCFHISLEGPKSNYTDMKDDIRRYEANYPTLNNLGFESYDAFEPMLDDFHNKFGNFAISATQNSHTNNMSIYVNHDAGNSDDAINHPMIQQIKSGFDTYSFGSIFVYADENITDSMWLELGTSCNSDIVYFYIFGTNSVQYRTY